MAEDNGKMTIEKLAQITQQEFLAAREDMNKRFDEMDKRFDLIDGKFDALAQILVGLS